MAARPDEPKPFRLKLDIPGLTKSLDQLESQLQVAFPDLQQTRWVALRLLEGDREVINAVKSDDLAQLTSFQAKSNTEPLSAS